MTDPDDSNLLKDPGNNDLTAGVEVDTGEGWKHFAHPTVGPQHFDSLDISDVHPTDLSEVFNSFGQAFANTPIAEGFKASQKLGREYLETSPAVTDDQISEFKKEAPGVNIPKGTQTNVAQLLVSDQRERNQRDIISALAKPGLASGAAKVLGSGLGQMPSPIGVLSAYFAPELVGMDRGFTAASLGDTAAQRLGVGAAIGASVAAPTAVFHDFKSAQFNQEWSLVNNALNVGQAAFIGGALNFGGHFLSDKIKGREKSDLVDPEPGTVENKIANFKPIGADNSNAAMQSATEQFINGKDVNNDIILKNAVSSNYQEFLKNLDPHSQDDVIAALEKSKKTVLNNIEANKSDMSEVQSQMEAQGQTPSLLKKAKNLALESVDHQQQLDNHNSVLSLMRDGFDAPSSADMDVYTNHLNNSEGNFANSGGYPERIDRGDAPENITTLNRDEFPDDYKKELIDDVGLNDADRQELRDVNTRIKNKGSYAKMVDQMITCITGT